MYSILKAEALASNIYSMLVKAPRVAKHCLPGQFVIVKSDEVGERIPLTICDYDREEGTITIVFQPIGASTEKFATLKTGDAFEDFVGPLGRPSELCTDDLEEVKKLKLLFVAGGVGTAPVYPQVKWLHEHGIDADVIVGAKTKEDAVTLSKSVVTSSLTKAAIYGHDANWGRILCAMGYSGVQFDPEIVDLYFESKAGKIKIMENGVSTGYSEEEATKILSEPEVTAIADVKMGEATATAWGCDLTYDYVKINADYRS